MKKIILTISALLSMNAVAQTKQMDCMEYEKTVTLDQTWLKCNMNYDRNTLVDVMISPVIDGKRYSISWSGKRFGPDAGVVSQILEVPSMKLSSDSIDARILIVPYTYANEQNTARGKIRARLLPGATPYSGSEFEGSVRFGSKIFGRDAICSYVTPAFYESFANDCPAGLVQDPYANGNAKRNCVGGEIWKKLNGGKIPRNRVHFVQDPVTLKERCVVNLE